MSKQVPMHLYHLADSLGFPIEAKRGKIRGDHRRQIDFGGLKVQFGVTIVSSALNERDCAVILRGPGNLGILAMAGGSAGQGRLCLLDLSKLAVKPEDVLEKKKISAQAAIEAFLLPSVVVVFEKANNKKWQEVTGAAYLDSRREGAD